jgi:hypothetical protein
MKSAVVAIALLASSAVYADTPSGPARGVTCSQLAAECRAYNKRKGLDVGQCAGYKASCIATGTYSTPNRHITDAVRR